MDVYGHLLAPSRMHAAEPMRRAQWIDQLPDFDPLATELATELAKELAIEALRISAGSPW